MYTIADSENASGRQAAEMHEFFARYPRSRGTRLGSALSAEIDVIIVGSGNAGFCAAHAARETGARVVLLEKGDESWAGGNTYFTAGAFRTTFGSLEDLIPLLHDPSDPRLETAHADPYAPADFAADMARLTEGECDPELTAVLVEEASDTMSWLREQGVRFELAYHRQAYEMDGRQRFWGNLVLTTVGGGKGLTADHQAAASRAGIEVRYDTPVEGLLSGEAGRIIGVVCRDGPLHASAVVLASGGFEADAQRRASFLGPEWEFAKVRGTPYNDGSLVLAAIESGAQPKGQWSGCHAVAWDAAAGPFGDRDLTHRYTKPSYPLGIMVNAEGNRFVDEGADFRNYTYAKYGAEILRQPERIAFQLFDAQTAPLLSASEYEAPGVSRYEAATMRELAGKVGIDPESLESTVGEFNASVRRGTFRPAVKDGKSTNGLALPKSNWAMPLASPPYLAFAVCCGVTFTFGGLATSTEGQVLGRDNLPIPGLFAAGETVGGIFYHNYPGGSGLTSGAVFGRRAGRLAATIAMQQGNGDKA